MVAHMARDVFPRMEGDLRLSFFCEKHGKGEIDAMFAEMEHWVGAYLKTGHKVISTAEQLVSVMKAAAAECNRKTGSLCEWQVHRFEMEERPPRQWKLYGKTFQISKTYCIELSVLPGPLADRERPRFVNFLFSDQPTGKVHHIGTESVPIEAGEFKEINIEFQDVQTGLNQAPLKVGNH